ncbi:MAG TPA: phosphoenolpyruvate carboxykinase domain-containing protein, partial [Chthoniobacterales bacterium]|nr:phosphoenolpyruvate carboxykinase domain-containing protein [Chthoniobacterales bacterium]
MRVLKWIIDRCQGTGRAIESPIGLIPGIHDIDLTGLNIDHKCVDELLEIDHQQWGKELEEHQKFYDSLGGVVPEELQKQREQVAERLKP